MEKSFKCDRCGKKTLKSTLAGIHDCVDSKGKHYDYCFECWSENTTDTDKDTNLIIS